MPVLVLSQNIVIATRAQRSSPMSSGCSPGPGIQACSYTDHNITNLKLEVRVSARTSTSTVRAPVAPSVVTRPPR